MDPEEHPARPLLAVDMEDILNTPIFPLIHRIKQDAIQNIDTALTWDQMRAPDVNFSVIKPLVTKYARLDNRGLICAFLIVRAHFLSSAAEDLAFAPLLNSRASFCELMAMKLLREFATNRMELVVVCTTPWNILQGAPEQTIKDIKDSVGEKESEEPVSALEAALMSEAKHFLSFPLVQDVVNDIWSGNVQFSSPSSRSLVADNYKSRYIATYHNPKAAPFLDHYRLRVPKYRAVIEMFNFSILLFLFVVCLANKDFSYAGPTEIIFGIFAFGFVLHEFAASQEHGWTIYAANMWNGFDLAFIILFLFYVVLRIKGLVDHNNELADLAFDILSCGACILFPRVAFFFISNNVVIVALRAMIAQFAIFIGVAVVCFSGLAFTLWRLSGPEWTIKKIIWLMVQIWFGNTYLSFNVAESFHPIFGPPLMIIYAALSNTLLIIILISILSATFAKIDAHASQEYLFQFALSTLEGVNSDVLVSYPPPFNIVAYMILGPASFILSPRPFHTLNVFLIRITSFPILLTITIYERYFAPGSKFMESGKGKAQALFDTLPRQIRNVAVLEAIVGSASNDLLDAIFDVNVPDHILSDEDGFDERGPVVNMPERPRSRDGMTTPPQQLIAPRGRFPSAPSSPGLRNARSSSRSYLAPPDSGSPLQKLFSTSKVGLAPSAADLTAISMGEEVVATVKKLEGMLDGVQDIQKMKTQMKETKEQLERIETLLLSLTRDARE